MWNFKELPPAKDDWSSVIEDMKAVDLSGKTLIITVKDSAHIEMVEHLRETLGARFPETRVLVLGQASIVVA